MVPTIKKHKILERILGISLFFCLILNSISFAEAISDSSIEFNIRSNDITVLNLNQFDFPFNQLSVKNPDRKGTTLEIEIIDRPIDKFLIAKPAFKYFSIQSSSSDLTLEYEFEVDMDWLQNNNLDEDDVSIFKFNKINNTWEELDSKVSYANAGNFYYKTKTDIGYFVIAAKDIPIIPTKVDTTSPTEEQSVEIQKETKTIEPTLEQPLPVEQNSSLSFILIGIIAFTLIGGSSAVFIINSKQKTQIPSYEKEYNNINLISDIENRIIQEAKTTSLIEKEIEELEPKIASKIAQTLKSNGFPPAQIREKLLSNNISEETINKVLA